MEQRSLHLFHTMEFVEVPVSVAFFPLILAPGTVINQWQVLIQSSAGTAHFLNEVII